MKYKKYNMPLIVLFVCLLMLASPLQSKADDKLDTIFNRTKAESSIDDLYQESVKFQLLAHKIKDDPLFKKTDSIRKDFHISIEITATDINSIGDIKTETLYLKPAYDRLYAKRYIEYLEYKNRKLQLELAKARGASDSETSKLSSDVDKLKEKLMKYLEENEWPD